MNVKRNIFLFILAILFFLLLLLSCDTDDCIIDNWTLVWNDEFNGTFLDSTKWNILEGIFGSYKQLYLSENISVQNGCLIIKSEEKDYTVDGIDIYYSSGFVHTKEIFSQAFGRFEVRAKLPSTKGIWPAIWLLAESHDEIATTPYEIDIMEMVGPDTDTIYMTNHFSDKNGASQSNGGTFTGPDFSLDFHTFVIEWGEGVIRWYIDDQLCFTSTIGVPNIPQFIILNTQVGDNWLGIEPDESSEFPQYYLIDYVRVYKKNLVTWLESVTE
ncbi:MAG: glycoside hydrolase family 16 protein [Candidatus Aminicenantes bacterium]|nr:glycoside hydrolase family 16 protein [Candidatus Aminicenantes bacterium]